MIDEYYSADGTVDVSSLSAAGVVGAGTSDLGRDGRSREVSDAAEGKDGGVRVPGEVAHWDPIASNGLREKR